MLSPGDISNPAGLESCLALSVATAKRAIWRIRLLRALRIRAARLAEAKA